MRKSTRGRSQKEHNLCFQHIQSCVLPPKDLEFTAGSEERDKSEECTLSLQETAHHGPGLRKFQTSRGYSVLGSTLAQPRGEINTPAGARKCVSVHGRTRRASVSVCVRTHSCVSSMTHIHVFCLLGKLVDPCMCWYLEGVPLQTRL